MLQEMYKDFEVAKTSFGKWIDFEAACEHMDDELREELHMKLSPCTSQEFYDAYCKEHEIRFGETFVCDGPQGQW